MTTYFILEVYVIAVHNMFERRQVIEYTNIGMEGQYDNDYQK